MDYEQNKKILSEERRREYNELLEKVKCRRTFYILLHCSKTGVGFICFQAPAVIKGSE